jgi:RNase P subunit RPR2
MARYIDSLGIMHSNIRFQKNEEDNCEVWCSVCSDYRTIQKEADNERETIECFASLHTKCSGTEHIIPPGNPENKKVPPQVYCSECHFPLLDLRQSYVKIYANYVRLLCSKCKGKGSATPVLKYVYNDAMWVINCRKFFITDFQEMKFLYDHYMYIQYSKIIQPQFPYPSSFDKVLIIRNSLCQN